MATGTKRDMGWQPSIGKLLAMGLKIRTICSKCRAYQDIDLVALQALKGPDYTLFNRQCRCRLTPGCNGWNRFYHNRAGVYQPFWSVERAHHWLLNR